MKKLLLISSLILSSNLASNAALADMSPHKKLGFFGGGAVIGAIVGGPIGYFVGATTGAYIAEKTEQVDEMKHKIADNHSQIEFLEDEMAFQQANLTKAQDSVASLEAQLKDEAEAPVFFETGSDQLTIQAKRKLAATIEYLQNKPISTVWLDGYSDPRGTDGYNLTLSQGRANNVKNYLIDNGIAEQLIQTKGYGIKNSSHDRTMFDLERRVDINIDINDSDNVVMK